MSKKNWRVILTGALIIMAFIALWDTYKLWTMDDAEVQAMQDDDPGGLLRLQQDAIRLGLDLQGGIHVVLRVKLEELDEGARVDAVDRAMQIIRNRVDGLGVAEPTIVKQGNNRIIVDLPGYTDADRAEELIGQTALLQFKLLETAANANLILSRLDSIIAEHERTRRGEVSGTTEVAETDSAGLVDLLTESDSSARSTSTDLMADLLGESTLDTADLFGFDEELGLSEDEYPLTARLELAFSGSKGVNWPSYAVAKKDRELIDRWLALPEAARVIPIDVQFAWGTRTEVRNSREVYYLYLMKRKVQFLGKYLENISLRRDPMSGFVVNFSLSGDGAARFAQLTGANIDKPLAIVLDDRVESAPFINSKIRRQGQISMGGKSYIGRVLHEEYLSNQC